MEGFFLNTGNSGPSASAGDTRLALLARRKDMEVMVQTLLENAVVWITPAEDRDTMEFFYVLSGELELIDGTEPKTIHAGDSFYADGLEDEVLLRVKQQSQLLYLTNKPLFDEVLGFQGNLDALMQQVDEKDNYTYQHSRNVLDYSLLLFQKLQPEAKINDLSTAALFHDVGKCLIPDEILKKPGKLTATEFQQIMKHPTASARMLQSRFGSHIAEISRSHHERMDGSGYPFGLSGEEIPLEGRIIAVADSFDAMTSKRVYKDSSMSFEAAAEELCSLPNLYDQKVTAALRELVETGVISRPKGESNENV